MKIKKKQSSLLLTIAVAALLVGGGVAAYWGLSQRGAGPGELPIGAEVIPQDALMAISVSTQPDQWQQLREFGTPQSQAAFDQSLAQLRDSFLTANGFNYEKDIQPWVGKEVTVAMLSGQAAPPPANTPNAPPVPQQAQPMVIVLPIQDPLKAKQVLEQPRSSLGQWANRTYKDIQIKETQGAATPKYSFAALDAKLLVIANDAAAMNRAIDTYKGGAALAATPGYTQALSKVQVAQPLGKLYANLPALAAVSAANAGQPVSPQNLAQVQQMQGLAATVSLQPNGVQVKGVSWLKPDSDRKYDTRNNAKLMPSRLPADTLIMASGGNLKRFWQDYTQGAATSPIAPIKPRDLQDGIQKSVGMDVEKDFLAWMEGEFALALIPPPDSNPQRLPFSLLFMVKSSDRRAGEAALKQLDQAVAARYKYKIDESKVNNQSVTTWALDLGAVVNHGWLDDDVAFLSLGAPVTNTLIPRPSATLADSDSFKKGVPTEPNPNNGHFFVDIDRANAKNLPVLSFLPPQYQSLFSGVRSIGVTAAVSDERSTRYDVLVTLQKTGKAAGPLPSPTIPASPAPGGAVPPAANPPALQLPPASPSPN